MNEVKLKKVSISTFGELICTISKSLKLCYDTQIFIEKNLFKRLMKENRSNIIWEEEVVDGFYYCDKIEKAFLIRYNNHLKSQTLQLNFVATNSDCMQLTYFSGMGHIYKHYLMGLKTVLIITSD